MNVPVSHVAICFVLNSFIVVKGFHVLLPPFTKFPYIQSTVHFSNSRIRMYMDKNDDIDEIFQEAMEEDEEWYNSFVRDVLGEDKVIREKSMDTEKEKTDETKKKFPEKNVDKPNIPLSSDYRKWKIGETENKTYERDQANPPSPGSEQVDEIATGTVASTKMMGEDDDNQESYNRESQDDIFIQYEDMYGDTQRLPYKILEKLGYKIPDLTKLQAEVLELIVEDNIPMPKRGIPKQWLIQDPDYKEVVILKKRQKSPVRGDRKRLPQGRKNRARFDDDRELRSNRKAFDMIDRPRKQKMNKRQSSRRSNEESDSIWMDIPSFKNYLRREAEFRLSILGPEWEDWVKGESKWRLDLYKKWLDLVEDGYGKDLMDDLYTVPHNERQKTNAKRPKPTIAGRRARPESMLRDRPMRQPPTRPTAPKNVGRPKRSRRVDDSEDDRFDRDRLYQKKRSGKENIGNESNFNAIEDCLVDMIDETSKMSNGRRANKRGLDDIDSFSDSSEDSLDDFDDASSISQNKYRSASRNMNSGRSRQENDTDYGSMNKYRRR